MNHDNPFDVEGFAQYRPEQILAMFQKDFRGPIALIEQCAELLAASDLEAEEREAVLSILRNTAAEARWLLVRYGSHNL